MGHFGAQELLDAGVDKVAVQLREPRARLLSLYRYWQSTSKEVRASWGPWGERALQAADLPLEGFLKSRHAWPATDNAIARQLLVEGSPKNPLTARREAVASLNGDGYKRLVDRLFYADWSSRSQHFANHIFAGFLAVESRKLERVNETLLDTDIVEQRISAGCRALILEMTEVDTLLIERLIADGLIGQLKREDRDTEFEEACRHLRLVLG
jgi:hypothetical protein